MTSSRSCISWAEAEPESRGETEAAACRGGAGRSWPAGAAARGAQRREIPSTWGCDRLWGRDSPKGVDRLEGAPVGAAFGEVCGRSARGMTLGVDSVGGPEIVRRLGAERLEVRCARVRVLAGASQASTGSARREGSLAGRRGACSGAPTRSPPREFLKASRMVTSTISPVRSTAASKWTISLRSVRPV